jgi:hypothetical protein
VCGFLNQYKIEKERIQDRLHLARIKIHLSCDIRTSPSCLPILGVVAHYVSEDNLASKLAILQSHPCLLPKICEVVPKFCALTGNRRRRGNLLRIRSEQGKTGIEREDGELPPSREGGAIFIPESHPTIRQAVAQQSAFKDSEWPDRPTSQVSPPHLSPLSPGTTSQESR